MNDLVRGLLAGASACLGLAAAAGALAAHGGRFSRLLDITAHFTPFFLAAGVLAVLLALPSGRLTAALPGLVAVLAAGALVLPEFLPRREPVPAGGSTGFTIVQFNAWGGPSLRIDAAEQWILAQQPDVVVLQEAWGLADRLVARGLHPSCRACDTVVLTRAPPVETAYAEQGPDGGVYVTAAMLEDAHGRFAVAGIHRHWPLDPVGYSEQSRIIQDFLGGQPKDRLIVAGDFNATPWSAALRAEDARLGLLRRTRGLFTWPAARVSHNRLPAPFPYLAIDHVYAGSGWATVSVARGPRLGSDHYPVVVRLAPTR